MSTGPATVKAAPPLARRAQQSQLQQDLSELDTFLRATRPHDAVTRRNLATTTD